MGSQQNCISALNPHWRRRGALKGLLSFCVSSRINQRILGASYFFFSLAATYITKGSPINWGTGSLNQNTIKSLAHLVHGSTQFWVTEVTASPIRSAGQRSRHLGESLWRWMRFSSTGRGVCWQMIDKFMGIWMSGISGRNYWEEFL